MQEETYLLEMDGINMSFGGIRALSDVSLRVKAGTVHALLGENGAGKSTLMKILSGIYIPDSGEIRLNGQVVQMDSVSKAIANGVSMIHQELSFIPELTVAENIYVGCEPCKKWFPIVDKRKMNQMAQAVFEQLNLRLNPSERMGNLSIAEKQMVEIAKAVSKHSKILVMDEPTSAITDREVERLFAIIEDLKAKGTAIIYISHKLDEIFKICDTITVLRDGHIIDTRAAGDLTEEELVPMLVGREVKEFYFKEQAQQGDVVLQVKDLCREGKFEHVSFSLRKGEILGIAGLMGAGRTEVAETIFGVAKKTSGEVYVKGKKVDIKSPHDAIKLGMGFVPEDRKNLGLNMRGNIRYNLTLTYLKQICVGQYMRTGKEKRVAAELIDRLSVKTANDLNPVDSLSGGNQQKVVIAKWLMGSPDILILDDPTRGIDVGAKAEIHRLMSQLAKEGKAIIMISSEMPEVLGVSDRVVVMREGRINGEFTKDQFDQNVIIKCAMGIA